MKGLFSCYSVVIRWLFNCYSVVPALRIQAINCVFAAKQSRNPSRWLSRMVRDFHFVSDGMDDNMIHPRKPQKNLLFVPHLRYGTKRRFFLGGGIVFFFYNNVIPTGFVNTSTPDSYRDHRLNEETLPSGQDYKFRTLV